MSAQQPLLAVAGLNKTFGGLKAVSDVSFGVMPGEIFGIIGPNGAGKTTLFNCLSGLLPLSAGSVHFEGRRIDGMRSHDICRLGLARTFQTTTLFDRSSVLDNLIVGHRLRTRSGLWDVLIDSKRLRHEEQACRDRARAALDFVGLSRVANRMAGDITQEERKRVAFALALATDPKLVLLDEPAGGVNPEETLGLAELIRKLVRHGLTVCLIEHKMNMIMNLADRILVLNHGEKIAEGSPAEIRGNPAVIDAYLGTDYAHEAPVDAQA